MEKRALIAVILSLIVLVAYQLFFIDHPKQSPPVPEPTPSESEAANGRGSPPFDGEKSEQKSQSGALFLQGKAAEIVTIETPLYRAELSDLGGILRSFKLTRYRGDIHDENSMVDMVRDKEEAGPFVYAKLDGQMFTDAAIKYEIEGLAAVKKVRIKEGEEKSIVFVRRLAGGAVRKRFVFQGGKYAIRTRVGFVGGRPGGALEPVGFSWKARADAEAKDALSDVAIYVDGKVQRESLAEAEEELNPQGKVEWVALGSRHFVTALATSQSREKNFAVTSDAGWLDLRIDVPQRKTASGYEAEASLFLGPKEVASLKEVGRGLEKAVDFGWFWFVAIPLLQALRFFHRVTDNYGIDIMILTAVIKVAFIPLTNKSLASMREMQRVQPEMAKIREKFKSDRERLNKEVMELYKRHKVNPLGGCLPMVLQLPVFVGLYNALLNAVELRHARFGLWIDDLSEPDRLMIAGVGVPVLTILMGASMLLQQWMTPTGGDPNQKLMMLILPVVFTFMFINFPAGLVLYWLVNNLLSIGQQYFFTGGRLGLKLFHVKQ